MQNLASSELQKTLSEKSLRHFIRNGWTAVESYEFKSNWHIDAICDHLQAVSDRQIKNLLINIPPRHMKSVGASVFWPAWTWAQDPDPFNEGHGYSVRPNTWRGPGVRYLTASYAYALSVRDAGNSKRLIETPWYKRQWGNRFSIRQDASANDMFANDKNGARLSISIEGQITGQGGDIILVDDPHNVMETDSQRQRENVIRWWQESLPSRLNDQENGAKILIMQRVHARDLTGHICAKEMGITSIGDPSTRSTHLVKWDHLCLPARYEGHHPTPVKSSLGFIDPRTHDGEPLWESRYNDAALKNLEAPMTSYAIAGQLQQRPAPREGGMFKRAFFENRIEKSPPLNAIRRLRRWDLAATDAKSGDPDWTVGALMSRTANNLFYIEDIIRFRGSPHEVEKNLKMAAVLDGKHIPIYLPRDPGQAGVSQAAYLIGKLAGWVVHAKQETGRKETRAEPFAAQCEAGNVRLVEGSWNLPFLEELESFPNALHDDQVDATSGGFNALISNYTGPLQGKYGYARR